jgi:uncharacterized protein YcaQ
VPTSAPGAVACTGGDDRVAAELADELATMAGWLGLDAGVDVEPGGHLAPALAAAVAAADRG